MRKNSTKNDPCTCNQYADYIACCETLYEFLNDCKVGIKYHKAERMISILIARDMGRQGIYNCPWCGFKFPPILTDKRNEILENEFGIDDYFDKEKVARIPAEFLTDEWWKKRGL